MTRIYGESEWRVRCDICWWSPEECHTSQCKEKYNPTALIRIGANWWNAGLASQFMDLIMETGSASDLWVLLFQVSYIARLNGIIWNLQQFWADSWNGRSWNSTSEALFALECWPESYKQSDCQSYDSSKVYRARITFGITWEYVKSFSLVLHHRSQNDSLPRRGVKGGNWAMMVAVFLSSSLFCILCIKAFWCSSHMWLLHSNLWIVPQSSINVQLKHCLGQSSMHNRSETNMCPFLAIR